MVVVLDLKQDYLLSHDFRQQHFLIGLLLHELKVALNEKLEIRQLAIITVRNLLAKHSLDDRYASKVSYLFKDFDRIVPILTYIYVCVDTH